MNWYYAYSQDLWPALVSIALTIFLGSYSWHQRRVPGAKAFAIGCFLAMLWAVGSILEIAAQVYSAKVFWIQFQALWQIPMVTALSCFFLEYAGFGRYLTRRNLILFSIPAVVVFGLMVTNNAHHIIWKSFSMGNPVAIEHGIGTWLSILYANLLGIVNFLALMRLAIRSPKSRWPVAIMFFGQVSGRVMYALDIFRNRAFSPGESAFVVIGVSCSAYAFALFYYRVLDPIPLARAVVIDQMADGMLVLDLKGRIVDINPAAEKIFATPASRLCGRSVVDVMPAEAGMVVQTGNLALEKTEISFGSDDLFRCYSLGLTNLFDRRREAIGHLLLIHDITGQRRSQELVMKHQRVVATLQERENLARELHDSIGQVLGYISMQAQAAHQWATVGNTGKTLPILQRLAEVAQSAHADVRESILSLRTGMAAEWTFQQALGKYLDHYRTSYGIDTELILPDGMEAIDLNPEVGIQVLRVIQEAMANANKHGCARRVRVAFAQAANHVRISINDDGSGFDPAKFNPESGKHLGLMLMRERMAQINGSVMIESQPGLGTTVSLDVPFGTETRRQLHEGSTGRR